MLMLRDVMQEYGWQVSAWIGVGGMTVVAGVMIGFATGVSVGLHRAPEYYRKALEKQLALTQAAEAREKEQKERADRADERISKVKGITRHFRDRLSTLILEDE